MNILLVNRKDIKDQSSGGALLSHRNYNALLLQQNTIVCFILADNYKIGKLAKRINLFNGRYFGLSKQSEQKILELCRSVGLVWLDSSCYGIISKKIKQMFPNIKVITHFHNCEYKYAKQEYMYNFVRQYVIKKNEEWACKYSDKIIVLNERDRNLIEKLYGRTADAVIPISFPNKEILFSKEKISNIPTVLFLGSKFYANIHGIKWFIEKVLPFVNIKLKIVGKGMDNVNFPESQKLKNFGYIENLDECIQQADFMILPIFKGGGMKVKTCEALMHGKNIIGTHEAFQGYDVDFEKIGACCEMAEEFIKAINEFPQRFTHKFNEYSRNVFLEKYCDDVTFKQFAEVFEK